MIAPATPSVAAITTGATTLGRTCMQEDSHIARAERPLGLHELELANDEHLSANEPRHARPARRRRS